MFERSIEVPDREGALPPSRTTLRDIASIFFRQRSWVAITFVFVLLALALSGFMKPTYESETQVLVRNDRSDPMVSSQDNAPPNLERAESAETELNSEVELIRSTELLTQAALKLNLETRERAGHFTRFTNRDPGQVKVAKAVKHLLQNLSVKPLQKTNIISIRYQSSTSPETAREVLATLDSLYLQKHADVNRSPEAFQLFDVEARKFEGELKSAEERLNAFNADHRVAAPQVERDLVLRNYADARANEKQAEMGIAETEQRMRLLDKDQHSVPERHATSMKSSENPALLEQMKSKLLELELKKTELLAKFEPTYKPVQDLNRQIAQTAAALNAEQQAPVHEETSDRNPARDWLDLELIKARADRQGYQAKAIAARNAAAQFESNAEKLQRDELLQSSLVRQLKIDEENYLRYSKKREEARIGDALDSRKVLNVTIAEAPTLPIFPVRPFWMSVVVGLLLSGIVAIGVGYVVDLMDGSFRTPQDVADSLGVPPVLASLPKLPHRLGDSDHLKQSAETSPRHPREQTSIGSSYASNGAFDAATFRKAQAIGLVQQIFLVAKHTCVVVCGVDEQQSTTSLISEMARTLSSQADGSICLAIVNSNGRDDQRSLRDLPAELPASTTRTDLNEPRRNLVVARNLFTNSDNSPFRPETLGKRIKELRQQFDYILIDVPPLGASSEALMAGHHADGVMLVLKADHTRRLAASKVREALAASGVPLLGVVLNNRTFPIPDLLYRFF